MSNGPYDFGIAELIRPTAEAQEQTLAKMIALGMTRDAAVQMLEETYQQTILKSSEYQVAIRKFENPSLGATMVHMSVKRIDKQPIHDWRALQAVKNVVLGEECEAIEIYPAESRLVDGANQYHLWGFDDPEARIPIGFDTRLVDVESIGGSVQRPFESPDALLPSKRQLIDSLRELSTWMRDNTGPSDGTLEMLSRAMKLLPPVAHESYKCRLCGQVITDGKPCGCGAR